MRAAITFAIFTLWAPLQSQGGVIEDFHTFGKIHSLVSVFEHGWNLGGGVEFADKDGHSLQVCVGYSPDHPHWGFRIGSLHPSDEGAEVVEVGSQVEIRLIGMIQEYLDERFTYVQQQRLIRGADLRELAKAGQKDAYLISMLYGVLKQSEISRWLHANYSPEKLEKLAQTPFREIQLETDREAVGYIRNLQLGIWPQNDRLTRGEYLKDYQLEKCGRDPLVIESVSTYYDGGSVGITVTDSTGCLVELCFDYGMSSITRGALYVDSLSPTSPNAKLASISEERRVIELIMLILNSTYSKECQQELLKLDKCPSIPTDDYRAWKLLHLLQGRSEG